MSSVLVVSLQSTAESSWGALVGGHSAVQSTYISDKDKVLQSSDIMECSSCRALKETRSKQHHKDQFIHQIIILHCND